MHSGLDVFLNHLPVRFVLVITTISILSSCVAVPERTTYYDESCDMFVNHFKLDVTYYGGASATCMGDQCVGELIFGSLVGAVSVAVSGTIVLVGNAVSEIERVTACDSEPQANAANIES